MTGPASAGVAIISATAAIVAMPATASPAAAHDGPQPGIQVLHAVARLVVIAEPRSDVSVTVAHGPNRLPALGIHHQGAEVVVDGSLADGAVRCAWSPSTGPFGWSMSVRAPPFRGERAAMVRGVGRIAYAELPVVTAHVPLDAAVASSGAVWGEVGAARSLKLAPMGCGDWQVGDIQGEFDLASLGSSDVRAGDAGQLRAALLGSGDLQLGRVADGAQIAVHGSGDLRATTIRGDLKIATEGSGDVTVQNIDGSVEAKSAGSSDIRLLSGHAPSIQAAVTGSGSFSFGGEAGGVQAAVSGSGDIRVAHARGPVSQARSGSGDVLIGPP